MNKNGTSQFRNEFTFLNVSNEVKIDFYFLGNGISDQLAIELCMFTVICHRKRIFSHI